MTAQAGAAWASASWSVRIAEQMLARRPLLSRRWHYEPGVMLLAYHRLWQMTGDDQYFDHVRRNVEALVDAGGCIRTYRLEDYNLDQINEGRLLFPLYDATGDERYRWAACRLRDQLHGQPRTGEGGFWHKRVYPHQMWLDGVYMACPFYAEFARRFGEPAGFDDVAHQITLIEKHTRDPRTGLPFHAWDETRSQRWANPETGCSPCLWGRAVGWYLMAIVDVLDYMPLHHPRRDELLAIFGRVAAAVAAVQDPSTGVWYQVLDQGERPGNYLESSASCMFVYAIAKGVRKGYLDPECLWVARRGHEGILARFVTVGGDGSVSLGGICAVAGLGGTPFRDGSFEYYAGEKVVENELKGVGAFVMAGIEMEQAT
ncbi:MAG TPA: glycoside hydrolase family 88 protein [Anaerolineae bacterium]|nr:glycoside hydrolase family 88 protein [Anaerolineae bacterium]